MPPHAPVNIQQRLKVLFCLYGKGPVNRNRIIKTGGYQAVPEILKQRAPEFLLSMMKLLLVYIED